MFSGSVVSTSETSLARYPRSSCNLQKRAHVLAALGLGLIFADAAEHREGELRLGGRFQQHAVRIDQQDAGAEGDERDGLALADANHQAVRPDARDGGVFHPVDGQQPAAALGQRHGEDAVFEIGGEDALHFEARRVDQALNGERILAIAGESELRIGD